MENNEKYESLKSFLTTTSINTINNNLNPMHEIILLKYVIILLVYQVYQDLCEFNA